MKRSVRAVSVALPALFLSAALGLPAAEVSKLSRWNQPLRGANYIVTDEAFEDDFAAARDYGMNVLRVFLPGVPRGWSEDDDFFASDAFTRGLERLDHVVERAARHDLLIVLAGGSVPGRQWLWTEHQRGDRRLWRQHWRHDELAAFWQRIARRYRDRTNVVGYELLNEPSAEQQEEREAWSRDDFVRFAEKVRGTPADLNLLYRRVIRAVREVDPQTPIILDSGAWASPASFVALEPIADDDAVIYSFHWYGPEAYTIWRENNGRHAYPGCVTLEPGAGETRVETTWTLATHRERMAGPVREWQTRHNVPSTRILCGEFSADRRVAGADAWNADVIRVLDENGWHWTYYAFRERDWSAKDFELGADPQCTMRSATEMMRTFSRAMTPSVKGP